uniref:EF-hand domain-containing protein n=1 Tax=Globisporangium ultimum (strain ATCC 200006 / CBS 805.95 / DAOM BR144) TaxID=431595 RepID=K3W8I7_GLOUD
MDTHRGYSQLCDAADVQHARRTIAQEHQLFVFPESPTQKPPNHASPTKAAARKKHEWWQTEPDPNAAADRHDVLATQQRLRDEVRRHDQNAWLGKHAKQRRFEFSAEQKKMLRQWFNALDADGSGKISVEELEDPMLSIGIVADPCEIKEIANKLDTDANGLIDFHEFVEFLTPHAKHHKSSLEKHEAMFMQLTKKMEHQSSGFLDINTQLSMERRRFILDAITHWPSQSIAEELTDLKKSKHILKPDEYDDSEKDGGQSGMESRFRKAAARKHKLEALKTRHQVEVRFQALEKVFLRNSNVKVRTRGFGERTR